MKKIFSVLLTIVMLFSLYTTSYAEEGAVSLGGDAVGTVIKLHIGSPTMTVNGREQSIDENGTVPIIKNGYTLLPIRAVVEAMGGAVEWENSSQSVILKHADKTIRLTINSLIASLNGEPRNLDVVPEIINGRTMLPIRFIAESFGYDVGWDGSNQMVTISEKEIPVQETNTPATAIETEPQNTNNILIAYFSRAGENYGVGYIEKGNTEIVAEMIAEQTGGTLFQIQPVTPYPDGYEDTKVIATREKDANARPAITSKVENMDSYDIVFIGYPIWYGTNPMIINTFLESYDLTGKTIIPFCTAAGSGFGSSISDIKKLCPGASFIDGFTVSGSDAQNSRSNVQSNITSWLEKIDVTSKKTADRPQAGSATQITMTIGNSVITATLDNSQTSKDFLSLLPLTITMNEWGGREYYGKLPIALSEDGEKITDFQNGDVTFYPPSGSLAIFFAKDDSSNQAGLVRMGKITSNLSVFDDMNDSVEMRIEIAK